MRSVINTALIWSATAASLIAAGCGGNVHATRDESEVRSLFRAIAADGRAHNFAHICRDEMSTVLPELDYLVGGRCADDLATEWLEGVQLSRIVSSTRVVVTGTRAMVFDGPAPDSAVRVNGRWKLAEFPRNTRHAAVGEACEVAESIGRGLRASHLPGPSPEVALGCNR